MPINATTLSSAVIPKASVGWMIPWGKQLGKQHPEQQILEDSFRSVVDGISHKLKMPQAVCQASTGFAAKAESRMELSEISKRISRA